MVFEFHINKGVLELFQVIGGEYCGFMRKMHKIKYMELSYGDS
jgi:hypothetical protein